MDIATSEQGEPAIIARGLVKRFDDTLAVDGVDITVRKGSITGILGPNGAGKNTTLRMLLGIIDPDEGERRVLGHDHPKDVARLIGYLPEERGLYPSMKAIEAIAFMGALRGLPLPQGRQRGRELLEQYGLEHAAERQIRQLSKGMAQIVQLLGTLVHEPQIVVLDEPFSGLDAINQGKLFAMLAISAIGIAVWGVAGATILTLGGRSLSEFANPGVGWPLFFAFGAIYFAMGYLLLGSIFLTIGSMAATVREVQTLNMPVTMAQVLVFFFASLAVTRTGSWFEFSAMAFPLSSPFAMLARAAVDEAIWPHLVAIAWQVLCVAVFVRVGSNLFRSRVLKSGPQGAKTKKRRLFSFASGKNSEQG